MPISVNIEARQTREGVNVRSVSTLERVYTNKMAQDRLEDFHPRLRDQKRWVCRCNPSTVRWISSTSQQDSGSKIRDWEMELKGIDAEIAFVAQDPEFWAFW